MLVRVLEAELALVAMPVVMVELIQIVIRGIYLMQNSNLLELINKNKIEMVDKMETVDNLINRMAITTISAKDNKINSTYLYSLKLKYYKLCINY